MGFKKNEPKEEIAAPKKVVVLQKVPPKKEEKKISEIQQVVEKKEVVPILQDVPALLPNTTEKKYDKIGLAGDNEVVRLFKSKLKMQGKKIGLVLMDFIVEWNKKN